MWYPARSVIAVPSVYSVGGCHESVTASTAVCVTDPAEELEALLLDELAAGAVVEQDGTVVPFCTGRVKSGLVVPSPTDALDAALAVVDVELDVSKGDPLPHAVNNPPAISEPAASSGHERTPVPLIGTPRHRPRF